MVISFGLEHGGACEEMARERFEEISTGPYSSGVCVFELSDIGDYLAAHRTARKRAQHARNLGYTFSRFNYADQIEELYAINTSLAERQGEPMHANYTTRWVLDQPPDYPCERHRINEFGVFWEGTLVAYTSIQVFGELALISNILGHGAHLRNDIMYLLAVESFRMLPKPICVFYNRWDTGTDGLRYFKSRLGFEVVSVEWTA